LFPTVIYNAPYFFFRNGYNAPYYF
jgi:hypothetical protein